MSDIRKFIQIINQAQDQDRSSELLEDFIIGVTTPAERKEIGHRIEIVERLLKGQTQHEIAGELGVGVATVTRGARELAQGRFKVLRDKS